MEPSSTFSTRASKTSHATTFIFFISSFPALKKGWYYPIIFQCCSLVMTATCSNKGNQQVHPSSRNLHDSPVVGKHLDICTYDMGMELQCSAAKKAAVLCEELNRSPPPIPASVCAMSSETVNRLPIISSVSVNAKHSASALKHRK